MIVPARSRRDDRWLPKSDYGHYVCKSDRLELARAFGWNGHRVEASRELREVLERARAEDGRAS